MRLLKLEGSKRSMTRTPDFPSARLFQYSSTESPRGFTVPMPVMTTRRAISLLLPLVQFVPGHFGDGSEIRKGRLVLFVPLEQDGLGAHQDDAQGIRVEVLAERLFDFLAGHGFQGFLVFGEV